MKNLKIIVNEGLKGNLCTKHCGSFIIKLRYRDDLPSLIRCLQEQCQGLSLYLRGSFYFPLEVGGTLLYFNEDIRVKTGKKVIWGQGIDVDCEDLVLTEDSLKILHDAQKEALDLLKSNNKEDGNGNV